MSWDDSLLKVYIDPIVAKLNETTTQWLDPQGPFEGIPTLIGEDHVAGSSMKAPPKVFWIPRFDDGYQVADEEPDDATAIYMTWTVVDVLCWGRTAGEAERLRNAVLNKATQIYSDGVVTPWKGRATYSRGITSGEKGITIKFQMGFKILILDTMGPTADITAVKFQPLPDDAPPPPLGEPGGEGVYVSDVLGENPQPLEP